MVATEDPVACSDAYVSKIVVVVGVVVKVFSSGVSKTVLQDQSESRREAVLFRLRLQEETVWTRVPRSSTSIQPPARI
jgi:DNA-binding IclR family transcriptional regulator